MGNNYERIAVVPAGAFGTAMGILAARNGHDVSLYVPRKETLQTIKETHQNPRLTGVDLPASIRVTNNLAEAIDDCETVVFAAPSHIAQRYAELLMDANGGKPMRMLSLTKGFHVSTTDEVMVFTDLIRSYDSTIQTAVESGPNFAKVVALGEEKVHTVIASEGDVRHLFDELFSTDTFKIELDTDERGVQVVGALKNEYAIGVGICDGADVSDEIITKLVENGPGELAQVSLLLGGREETAYGIAGIDDLRLTCSSGSRNYRAGMTMGAKRKNPEELVKDAIIGKEVVEGVHTAWAVKVLSEQYDITIPVMSTVADVLYDGLGLDEAVQRIVKTI